MNKPYTIGTRRYYAWAKLGEDEGIAGSRFDELVEEMCELLESGDIPPNNYLQGKQRLKNMLDLFDSCECEGECY